MWTYRNESSSNTASQSSRLASNYDQSISQSIKSDKNERNTFLYAKSAGRNSLPNKNFRITRRLNRSAKWPYSFILGATLYLIGILFGALWKPDTNSWMQGYAQYYVNSQVSRFWEQQASLIFFAQFLALLMQLLLSALAGFCAFGVVLLPVILLLKGVGIGFFISSLYLEYGLVKGICMELLFFFIPQIFGLFLMLCQCTIAWNLSRAILDMCIRNRGSSLTSIGKRVLERFLLCAVASLIPCMISAISSLLFVNLFLS